METAGTGMDMVDTVLAALRPAVPGIEADSSIEVWRDRMPEPDVTLTVRDLARLLAGAVR